VKIGAVLNPRGWERWEEAERLLEPARARGDFPSVLDDDELLFAVLDGDDLLACATAWLSTDGVVEVKLIGGRDHRRWLRELDEKIGAEARQAGAVRMIGIGRRGWLRELKRLGWAQSGKIEDHWLFVKEL
jgi:hypothetical protein